MLKTKQEPLAIPITLEDLDEVISQEQAQLGLTIRPLGSAAYTDAQRQWDILETVRGYGRPSEGDEPRQGARRASEASEAGGRAGREER